MEFCRAHGTLSSLFVQIGTDETTRPRMLSLLHTMYGLGSFIQQFYSLSLAVFKMQIGFIFLGLIPVVSVMF